LKQPRKNTRKIILFLSIILKDRGLRSYLSGLRRVALFLTS